MQVVDEIERRCPTAGHAAGGHIIGIALVAQQCGLFYSQTQDFVDKLGIIILSRPLGAHGVPDALAQGFAVRKGHHRLDRGELQREAPLRGFLRAMSLGQSIQPRRLAGRFRQPGNFCRVCGHVFPGVGGIQHVLPELLGELCQLRGQLSIAPLGLLRQIRTALAEIGQGFLDEALFHRGELLHPGLGGGILQHGVEAGIECHAAGEHDHLRHQLIHHLAAGGGIHDGLQMREPLPAAHEGGAALLHGGKGVVPAGFLHRTDGLYGGLGLLDGLRDFHAGALRGQPAPRRHQRIFQKGSISHS